MTTMSAKSRITRSYQNVSLSKVLEDLNAAADSQTIYFIYDELEDFTVTCSFKRLTLDDAVRTVIGFYPITTIHKGNRIFVECMQKTFHRLIGDVTDEQGQPVQYANIALYHLTDSTMIGGGVSNETGHFVIPCAEERAIVRISCIGFKTINRILPISKVGTIHMQMENHYLNNVTMNGQMPVIRNRADRLQYIVSNDEFARGLSAQELLIRVPMVTMTGGQAMILGKGPAHFMINGRITDLGDEAIRQKLWTMRSEDIERIEVLSIPSGRDMLEMGGGYINIVLRRDQTLGWRGDLGAEAGTSDEWSGRANGLVSYASEKFDMTIDAHGGRSTQTTDEQTTYSLPSRTTSYSISPNYISDNHTKKTDKELAANLMLRYQPTNQLELGGMLSWQALWPKTVTNGEPNYPVNISTSTSEQRPDNNTTAKSLTVYCDWRLDAKGKLLSITYQNYKKDDDGRSEVETNYQNDDFYPFIKWQNFQSQVDYHIQSARFDLTLPFRFLTIDAGASYTNIRNQAHIEIESGTTTGSRQTTSSDPDYQEKTKAAYLSLHHEWNRLSVKAGLRYEHIGWEEDCRDYWLPSASLSVKPREGHHVSLSWGTNCLRPNFYDLNPFRVYKTGYEYSEGNPKLKPSRMSNIELSYQNHKGLYTCAYFHHGSNVVMQQTYFSTYQIQYKPLAETMPYNLGRTNQTGLYLRYQRPLSDHLTATAEGDGYYHDIHTYDKTDLHGWGSRLVASADWYLNRQHTLLLNARYQHWLADYHDMTKTDGYGYFTFALRYALMDDRLKLSLVANDPFRQHVTDMTVYNSRNWVYDSFTPYHEPMQQWSHTRHHSHYIGLTVTYAFGNKERQVRHNINDTESKRAEKVTL